MSQAPNIVAQLTNAQAGWLIAFVSSIIAATSQPNYPNYAWWSLVYLLFCIIGVIFVVGSDSIHIYHVALSSFLAAAMVLATSSVNSLIYWNSASKEAGAAGFILLSIVSVRHHPIPWFQRS